MRAKTVVGFLYNTLIPRPTSRAASGRGYIGANPDKLKIVGDAIKSEDFGFIFQQGSDLVEPFDAAIASMKEDGFIYYLDNKWFFLTDPNAADIYDSLPNLEGRKVAAAVANDYTPLQFVDPKTGVSGRLGIRCGGGDVPAAELRRWTGRTRRGMR